MTQLFYFFYTFCNLSLRNFRSNSLFLEIGCKFLRCLFSFLQRLRAIGQCPVLSPNLVGIFLQSPGQLLGLRRLRIELVAQLAKFFCFCLSILKFSLGRFARNSFFLQVGGEFTRGPFTFL